MINFNKVFNTKIISLIIIYTFLLTNTSYGIDLSKEPCLRKPLDFNDANGDKRYRSALSVEAGQAKIGGRNKHFEKLCALPETNTYKRLGGKGELFLGHRLMADGSKAKNKRPAAVFGESYGQRKVKVVIKSELVFSCSFEEPKEQIIFSFIFDESTKRYAYSWYGGLNSKQYQLLREKHQIHHIRPKGRFVYLGGESQPLFCLDRELIEEEWLDIFDIRKNHSGRTIAGTCHILRNNKIVDIVSLPMIYKASANSLPEDFSYSEVDFWDVFYKLSRDLLDGLGGTYIVSGKKVNQEDGIIDLDGYWMQVSDYPSQGIYLRGAEIELKVINGEKSFVKFTRALDKTGNPLIIDVRKSVKRESVKKQLFEKLGISSNTARGATGPESLYGDEENRASQKSSKLGLAERAKQLLKIFKRGVLPGKKKTENNEFALRWEAYEKIHKTIKNSPALQALPEMQALFKKVAPRLNKRIKDVRQLRSGSPRGSKPAQNFNSRPLISASDVPSAKNRGFHATGALTVVGKTPRARQSTPKKTITQTSVDENDNRYIDSASNANSIVFAREIAWDEIMLIRKWLQDGINKELTMREWEESIGLLELLVVEKVLNETPSDKIVYDKKRGIVGLALMILGDKFFNGNFSIANRVFEETYRSKGFKEAYEEGGEKLEKFNDDLERETGYKLMLDPLYNNNWTLMTPSKYELRRLVRILREEDNNGYFASSLRNSDYKEEITKEFMKITKGQKRQAYTSLPLGWEQDDKTNGSSPIKDAYVEASSQVTANPAAGVPDDALSGIKERLPQGKKFARSQDVDYRPVQSGLMEVRFVGYDTALRKIINPKHEDMVAVYGSGGSDISNLLISTNATRSYIIDKLEPGKSEVDIEMLESLKNKEWDSLDKQDWAVSYLRTKRSVNIALAEKNDYISDIERKIILELKCMGVEKDDIRFFKKDGLPTIEFTWAYAGQSSKKYTISYVGADLLHPDEYMNLLRDLTKDVGGLDIYYQKGSVSMPEHYQDFLPHIAQLLKTGGYIVTDDIARYERRGQRYVSAQNMLEENNLNGYLYLTPTALDGDSELKVWEKAILEMFNLGKEYKHDGYGWRMFITQKSSGSPDAITSGIKGMFQKNALSSSI